MAVIDQKASDVKYMLGAHWTNAITAADTASF